MEGFWAQSRYYKGIQGFWAILMLKDSGFGVWGPFYFGVKLRSFRGFRVLGFRVVLGIVMGNTSPNHKSIS